jgi:hypothetical protein
MFFRVLSRPERHPAKSFRGFLLSATCDQIVPVKVKFDQVFPQLAKNADKISCIINTLKL